MSTKIVMPQLGESVAEGVIGKWLKAEGDAIEKDEPIVEVITDKVNAEIPSPVAGTLEKITAAEGETVPVGHEIALIGSANGATAGADQAPAIATSAQASERVPTPDGVDSQVRIDANQRQEIQPSGRVVRSSPLVQRLAQEHGIDLGQVSGTGIGGRVSKKDVMAFIERGTAGQPAVDAPQHVEAPPRPQTPPPSPMALGDEALTISPVRRMIAEHMVRSKYTIPHATTMIEVDMTNVAMYREANKARWQEREGVALSYMAFVALATVEALRKYPLVNSQWTDDKIILKRNINLGLAVAATDGLVVPNIKNADRLSLGGLAHVVADLTLRARNRKLMPDDMSGGTFTLNNTGAIGSVWSISIINYPQAGILSADAIVKRVRVMPDDSIAVRHMMNLSMSFDHRTLDGGTISEFMQYIRGRLEQWPIDFPLT
jgi:2-oxoisovalerate dehydrogenase E2 component (dihydrolipoyl transacylase)